MATPAQVMYDGRLVSTSTALGKEILKFEKPYSHCEYPKMLYKAAMTPSGQVRVHELRPDTSSIRWSDADLAKEQTRVQNFDRGNQFTVRDENEHKNALNAGWRPLDEALAHYEARERKIGDAAAERAHEDAKMSEAAQAEARAADDSTEFHLPEIPVKRKGRPRKAA